MKTLLLSIILIISVYNISAQTYIAPQGKIHFHSSAPLEDIDAVSSEGKCELDVKNKKVVAKVEMKSFLFPKPLMQQHFNESYIESDKFPYAILDAEIISNVSYKKNGIQNVTLKGTFEVHGVKQQRMINGQLTIKNGEPEKATAVFEVRLVDHNIKVPSIVVMNIAEIIKVDVSFVFNKIK